MTEVAMEGADAILTADLCKRYGSHVAVNGLSLRVSKGDIFGFLGPNGAGKTTTLRILTGVLALSSGSARVLGLDVAKDPESIKRRVAYLPQAEVLYGDLTALENVLFIQSLYGVPRNSRLDLARETLDLMGLGAFARRRARALSGGERRLLALACVVAVRQSLIILDEPTSGLDPDRRALVWDVLHLLRASGTTILVTTHAMDEADRCLHLGLMHHGRLLVSAAPAEIRAQYPHRIYEVDYGTTAPDRNLIGAAVSIHRLSVRGSRVRIATDLSSAEEVAARLESAALPSSVRACEPDLEDVFLSLTDRVKEAP